jgi:hydroxymethylglutaryl-CoA synthase
MQTFGIDRIHFYTPEFAFNLSELAQQHGLPTEYYLQHIGQQTMAVMPPDQDIITMAAQAARRALVDENKNDITWVLFATESSFDQSKSAGLFLHELLKLPSHCRVVELKQACYSATAGLQMALALLQQNPAQKILLLASDIARYEMNSVAEASQGAGAVAMLLSANPRVLAIEPTSAVYSDSVMDFWRPYYLDQALVDGKYSSKLYLNTLEHTWKMYTKQSGFGLSEHDYFCFHVPVCQLAERAYKHLHKISGQLATYGPQRSAQQVDLGLAYNRVIGNCYTASLYLSLCSLLDNATTDLSDQRIGCFSYGSGCVAEYFSMIVQPGYQHVLDSDYQQTMLAQRQTFNLQQYRDFYRFSYPTDGSLCKIPRVSDSAYFWLDSIEQHQRKYQYDDDTKQSTG